MHSRDKTIIDIIHLREEKKKGERILLVQNVIIEALSCN